MTPRPAPYRRQKINATLRSRTNARSDRWKTASLVIVAFVVGAACQGAPKPQGVPSPAPEAKAPKAAVASPASPLAELPLELQDAFRDRQQCNLLKGCEPVNALVALGANATAAACTFYEESAGDADRYYRSRILEALGRLGGADAEECLIRALTNGRWLDQSIAAFALGDLKTRRAQPPLQQLLDDPAQKPGLALRAGLVYALVRLGAKPPIDELWRSLEPGQVSIHNWGYLRFVVRAAAKLKSRNQATAIAGLVAHPDYYLKREALQALAVLGDNATARQVATALDVEFPGIQREAARTLRALKLDTGEKRPRTVSEWRAWRDAKWPPSPDASPKAPPPASTRSTPSRRAQP